MPQAKNRTSSRVELPPSVCSPLPNTVPFSPRSVPERLTSNPGPDVASIAPSCWGHQDALLNRWGMRPAARQVSLDSETLRPLSSRSKQRHPFPKQRPQAQDHLELPQPVHGQYPPSVGRHLHKLGSLGDDLAPSAVPVWTEPLIREPVLHLRLW